MTVGINLLIIQKSGAIGGVESYVRNLLDALDSAESVNRYIVFCRPSMSGFFRFEGSPVETVVVDEDSVYRRGIRYLQFQSILGSKIRMPIDEAIDSHGIDVMLYPCTILYPPMSRNRPTVLTVADIQQEYYPEFFTSSELRRRRRHYRSSVLGANRIVAVSEYTKQTLVEKYDVASDKIDVVYETISPEFHQDISADQLSEIKLKYHLPDRFVLYPAATWVHKNHAILLEALAGIRDRTGACPTLVLTGMKGDHHQVVKKMIEQLRLDGCVRHRGFVPYKDMPAIYRLASALVFPSLFEGFGIPIVEAMASNVPIACSNRTSLPEIAADAALLFDPSSAKEIDSALERILYDANLRDELVRRGRKRVEMFAPSHLRRNMEKVFRTVAGEISLMPRDQIRVSVTA